MASNIDYNQLWGEVKDYARLRLDYSRLTFAEKTSLILSRIGLVAVLLLLGVGILFFLLMALAHVIGESLGSESAGYLISAALFALLVAIVVVFKKQLIVNPVTRFITKQLLPRDDEK